MFEFLKSFTDVIDMFLNIIEFLAIVASVFTFFFLMLNKYSKALKKVLSPCGIGFWVRVRALFICRKSQSKKRAFIEFAILKTRGNPVINSEWHAIINEFKVFYNDASEQGGLIYLVPNCTSIIDGEFSEAVQRYFDYFGDPKIKRAFGVGDGGFGWVITIRMEEAYATPTCLLTGLLSHYDENWEEFIKRYVSTAYISENGESLSVLSNELYFTFAWLLWGPSYELEYKNYWAGLCQLSYGDESNSVPAVADADSDVAEKLKNKFLENDNHRYGALISADVELCEKKTFYSSLRSRINPDNRYFYEKVENGDFSFGLRIKDFTPSLNYKAKKYYSTAYVWILFEVEEEDYAFNPEKSVAFFEHANLADKGTYTFLVETLIDKSLKHFEDIYSLPENEERTYRFVCAMNDTIAKRCMERFKEVIDSGSDLGKTLKERVLFEVKHSPAEVFSAFDEYFAPYKQLEYEEVSIKDQVSVADFGQFYTNVYMEAFPDENERETFDSFLGYLKNAESAVDYRYHILLAKDENGRIVGGCVFNYFKKTNSGVIEFLAVKSDLQSGGIGTMIYQHTLSVLAADAYNLNGKALDYVCCEIDAPEYSRAEVKKYLYFWNKNNYKHLGFNYVQPALSAGQEAVTGLWFNISSQSAAANKIRSQTVVDILYDYLHFAMRIDDPEKCDEFIAMKNELLTKDTVDVSRIIDN